MTWIRVDSDFPENGKLGAFVNRLTTQERRVSLAEAAGHALFIWLWVGDHRWDGNLKDVPNETLESAAHWRGEPDVLAAAFRDVFCDRYGRIKGWLERQGKLVEWKRKNTDRKRVSRGDGAGASP